MLGGMTDMSALREAEQALQESSELLAIASDAARIGGWKLELSPRRVIWSDAVRRIHEVPADYEPVLETALSFYPLRERSRMIIAIDECIAYGKPFDLGLQFTTASGRDIWVRGIGRPLRDADGGIVCCQDARTGQMVYEERLEPDSGRIWASPVLADGKLYYVSQNDGTFVVAASPEYKLLAHNKIASDTSRTNASPAVSDGQLLLRSDRRLYCIGRE